MKKLMIAISSLICAIAVVVVLRSLPAEASELYPVEEYNQLVEFNILNQDEISYEEWVELNELNDEARKKVEADMREFEKNQSDFSS